MNSEDVTYSETATYSFIGIDQVPSTCQLNIYRRPNFDVVIVENSNDADQTLAIKRLESIINGATLKYQLAPQRTTWLTYTPEPLNLLGDFRKVPVQYQDKSITLADPGKPWDYVSKADVEEMIGTTVDASS